MILHFHYYKEFNVSQFKFNSGLFGKYYEANKH